MAKREEIVESFGSIYTSITEDVVNKCLEICNKYNIGGEYLADEWAAFTVSNLNGEEPTVEYLETMVRKESSKLMKHQSNKDHSSFQSSVKSIGDVDNMQSGESMEYFTSGLTHQSVDCLPRYSSPSTLKPNGPSDRNTSAPTTPCSSRPNTTHRSTPTTNGRSTPIAVGSPNMGQTDGPTYAERTDSGRVLETFGIDDIKKVATFRRKSTTCTSLSIKLWDKTNNNMSSNVCYMFESMLKRAESLNIFADTVKQTFCEKLDGPELKSFTEQNEDIVTYGRIKCDYDDGKLNEESIMLEETMDFSGGSTISLNLKAARPYSIFPGQIVLLKGYKLLNSKVPKLVVNSIFSDATLPLAEVPKPLKDMHEPLQIVVAAGPFTVPNDVTYQPLEDLLKQTKERKPHVLILMGPFIDCSSTNSYEIGEEYHEFFELLMERTMESLKDTGTEVILLPSFKDLCHYPVYPTPPYSLKRHYKNLHVFPDPCIINVNGVVIGATTVDPLFALARGEVSVGMSDRLRRLAYHILSQQCFYPLYPYHEDIPIDIGLLEQFGALNITPHALILPSNLQHFIKDVGGCLIINPQRLTRGFTAGSYARIEVHPGDADSLCNSSVCEIVRI